MDECVSSRLHCASAIYRRAESTTTLVFHRLRHATGFNPVGFVFRTGSRVESLSRKSPRRRLVGDETPRNGRFTAHGEKRENNDVARAIGVRDDRVEICAIAANLGSNCFYRTLSGQIRPGPARRRVKRIVENASPPIVPGLVKISSTPLSPECLDYMFGNTQTIFAAEDVR